MNICNNCDYIWETRFPDRKPKSCPNCKTRKWDGSQIPKIKKDVKVNKCNNCEYEWEQRISTTPVACPMCQSRKWNIEL